MNQIIHLLRERHLKVTPQRIAIYQMLANTASHPSAETIYQALEKDHPSMSLATVYKTLDAFVESGLVQELHTGDSHVRYDAYTEEHPHFVCTCCQNVYDMQTKNNQNFSDFIKLPQGFQINTEKLFFYGLCADCNGTKTLS